MGAAAQPRPVSFDPRTARGRALPCHRRPVAAAAATAPSAPPAVKRVLIVEDHADLAVGLQRNLEREGHRAAVAATAAEALVAAARETPDLVVLDLGLPDRDGYWVLEQLRERGCQAPVVILSARGLEADKVRGFRLGADDYVTKPFGVVELMARVAAHLRRASAADDPAAGGGRELTDEALHERYGLTEREIQVARLLALGHSNAEAGEVLGISTLTARNHTERVLMKLGASTRARVGAILRGQVEGRAAGVPAER